MRALLPYLALYKRHKWMLLLGVVLAIVTLLASIGLLTLSGWCLSGGGRRRDLQFNYAACRGRSRRGNYPYRRALL